MKGNEAKYSSIKTFYAGVKEDIPSIMKEFEEHPRIKRTITVPKAIDDVLHRVIRADLLKLHSQEVTYSDLIAAFIMMGFARTASKEVILELCKELEFIESYDQITRERGE